MVVIAVPTGVLMNQYLVLLAAVVVAAIVALGLRWALRKDLLGEHFFVIRRWRAFPHNR